MTAKVLVTYATKNVSKAEIAEKISQVLADSGLNTELIPVKKVQNVNDYAGVVLGSAVYMGNWRREARKFLYFKEKELAGIPVWFFSSGPVGEGDPVDLLDGWQFPPRLQIVADRIKPRDIVVFHGVVDPEKLTKFDNWIMKRIDSPRGDFRDWEAINSWAQSIAEELK
jgi:menaquinone-dependent protoporphyrinogen oxidase